MIYALLGVIIVLQIALIVRTYGIKLPDTPLTPSSDADVLAAIARAFVYCGLNADRFHEQYDLTPTGKIGNVLVHASEDLGRPIKTVQDLHDLLK